MRQFLLAAGILGGTMPVLLAQPIPAAPQASQTIPASPAISAPPANPAPPTTSTPRFADTVVVTPSLEAEPRDDTPAAVTVIDGQEIEARQARSLADLLWSVPG